MQQLKNFVKNIQKIIKKGCPACECVNTSPIFEKE